MDLNRLLPKTREPFLLVIVLLLVAACLLQAASWLRDVLVDQEWWSFPGVLFWSALALGLWLLHPVARRVAVVSLWAFIFILILGTFNPFNAGDLITQDGVAPTVLELALWIAPLVIVALLALHALGKYKTAFRAGKEVGL